MIFPDDDWLNPPIELAFVHHFWGTMHALPCVCFKVIGSTVSVSSTFSFLGGFSSDDSFNSFQVPSPQLLPQGQTYESLFCLAHSATHFTRCGPSAKTLHDCPQRKPSTGGSWLCRVALILVPWELLKSMGRVMTEKNFRLFLGFSKIRVGF